MKTWPLIQLSSVIYTNRLCAKLTPTGYNVLEPHLRKDGLFEDDIVYPNELGVELSYILTLRVDVIVGHTNPKIVDG